MVLFYVNMQCTVLFVTFLLGLCHNKGSFNSYVLTVADVVNINFYWRWFVFNVSTVTVGVGCFPGDNAMPLID